MEEALVNGLVILCIFFFITFDNCAERAVRGGEEGRREGEGGRKGGKEGGREGRGIERVETMHFLPANTIYTIE